MRTAWVLPDYYLNTTCPLLVHYLSTTWILLSKTYVLPDYYLSTTWVLPEYNLSTTSVLPDFYLNKTCALPDYYLTITWVQPEYNLITSEYCLSTSWLIHEFEYNLSTTWILLYLTLLWENSLLPTFNLIEHTNFWGGFCKNRNCKGTLANLLGQIEIKKNVFLVIK